MRITGGEMRGRRLTAPTGRAIRPTTDRVRESLFNILAHAPWAKLTGAKLTTGEALVLDAFAGAGTLGFEALSRGAERVWFWDQAAGATSVIRETANQLKVSDRVQVQRLDATKPPAAPRPVDLIFLDPPYEQGFLPLSMAGLLASGWLHADTLLMAETKKREHLVLDGHWQLLDRRDIGDTGLNFLRLQPEDAV
ncbi:MAG: 16S rRNA (guanine(966)-N(2))-methyltransferase RsmD [Alphaproteobacteria bacterium]|nr:16S rRNA (guanine(966)-N(2))-methyltransferase RsmD [Alphaproteobacteria bacterium SS10]